MTRATTSSAHYISSVFLKIDGRPVPGDSLTDRLMEDLLQVSVEESLHLPSLFTLVVKNDYFPGQPEDEQTWRYDELLRIGNKVQIGFQSSTTADEDYADAEKDYVFSGEITAIETHFTGTSQAPIIVRGYDISHRLHRGRHSRSFQDMTDSDIVQQIADSSNLDIGQIDSSGSPHAYVFQQNQTNMAFLRERAARNGFELFVQDGKLFFRKPKSGETVDLEWLRDLHSFRVRTTSAEQVSGVEVRAWDYSEKKPVVATRQSESVITQTQQDSGSSTSTRFSVDAPKMVVVDCPVSYPKEADAIAQAVCDELGGDFLQADAKGEGNPNIRPGKRVQLSEMGPYSGKYYVTETRHLFHERIYTTEFSVRGLRGGDLRSLSPDVRLKPGQTPLVGIVTNIKDPDDMGRVKVKFPTLTEDHESNWARVVGLGAGSQRGFYCLPEVNDEVLVAFEHGDIHRPYVIGGVWNGKDAAPEAVDSAVKNGRVRVRTFKSRESHEVKLVDEDQGSSKTGVYLTTAGGHQIWMNDSDQVIEIKTTGGHVLKLDDRGQQIDLKTSQGGASITMRSSGTLDIQAQAKISLSAPAIDIKAQGPVTVQGLPIKLN